MPCIFLLRIYGLFISPLFGNCCRFYPSCSQYAQEALLQYGIARGISLTIFRLLRCHPFHPGGYDPIPFAQEKDK
jgi:putative membrane protein insertion efficiency factor